MNRRVSVPSSATYASVRPSGERATIDPVPAVPPSNCLPSGSVSTNTPSTDGADSVGERQTAVNQPSPAPARSAAASARDHSRPDGAAGRTGSPCCPSVSIHASPMSRRRRRGSFSRQRFTSRRSAGGVTAAAPPNPALDRGWRPADRSSSYRRTPGGTPASRRGQPKAQMSVRLSTLCPRACSGLM